ncbi:MAG: hypothetical protein ABIN57_02355 [Chitinophagaceae bacterium]
MKRFLAFFILLFSFLLYSLSAGAQCSICSRTVEQMGEKSALGLNSGIIYLMAVPFMIVGIIAYRWWRQNERGSQG